MPLNNQLKTPDNRLITPKIKSLKNRFAPASTKKQLNFDNGSIVLGSEHETYEHLAMKPLDDQRCYETLNNLLATPDDRFITPKIKSIKNQLALQSAKKQLNFCRVPMEQGTGFDHYEHLSAETLGELTYYATLNNRLNDQFATPKLTTPTGSIFSGSYCDILTPISDNRSNRTIGETGQPYPMEYGLFPLPRLPIRGRHSYNKRGKITYLASSVERKPKTGLFSRAKKEKSTKTSLIQTSQAEDQRHDEKSSQVTISFKRDKHRSSLSKLKHRITRKKQSLKGTSPNTSPFKNPQQNCNENLHQTFDKSSLDKGFISKCRNRLQNLALF